MKNLYTLSLLFFAALSMSCEQEKNSEAPAPYGPVPSQEQLDWYDMEMNAFIHFTINTFTDKEWGYGDESPELFNPTNLDTDQWMSTLKDAGFSGAILTAKHHDGFALWPSEYTEHDIAASPYKDGKGDLVKEVSQSAKKFGLEFGVYLSPWDRNRADYGEPSYVDYYSDQVNELFTGYGAVFEMWFDGANGGDGYYGGANEERKIDRETYYNWPKTIAMAKEIQPQVLFFSDAGPDLRWVGNERGIGGETHWNTISTDTLYAGKSDIGDILQTGSPDGKNWVPAEVNTSIRPGWFYHASEDSLVRTPENLFELYLTSVGRGSTLLLNIPPDRRGLFHENDVAALQGFRKILDSVFAENLAKNATAVANTSQGETPVYAADKVLDGDAETYWATNDGVTTGSIELTWEAPQKLNYLVLQEYIKLGQRVAAFTVSVWEDGKWKEVQSQATIGHKRILKLNGVETSKLKVDITESLACPLISTIEVY
ncbi:alpha-L-fucosidase [Leeuwenhoekiella aestuarii]|uniref:alpha-L-fucosidase n=1 Tax=Leeuwenhoekiella aestuarii TaxID=2249426 RepID=A0A4Q0NNR5_9FLAO|nr:alpha-L-fucosidase [Leeuwenhoekiella aestuarii]RXG11678.1 alpha-L-fucosidase [Leeuwenhoekiella aestuarii]RXG12733.1 alpha-L-fucosidase [Leeuwenhoekiella aestuarii]